MVEFDFEIEKLNRLLEEYEEEITNLKKICLGNSLTINNRKFCNLLLKIFEEKYTSEKLNLKNIANEIALDIKVVEKVYSMLQDKKDSTDFDILRKIIPVSKYSEDERIDAIKKIIDGKDKSEKVFNFNPIDLISDVHINELYNDIYNIYLKKGVKELESKLRIDSNPRTTFRTEYIEIVSIYKDKIKASDELKILENKRVYLVKEEGELLKLFDPETLEPIGKDIRIAKKMVIREPV